MQPTDDVHLRSATIRRSPRLLLDLFDRVLVRALLVALPVEGAEGAAQGADIRVVDVAIEVVVRHVAVHPAPHEIGQLAERPEVVRLVQRHALRCRQASTVAHLRGNRGHRRIARRVRSAGGRGQGRHSEAPQRGRHGSPRPEGSSQSLGLCVSRGGRSGSRMMVGSRGEPIMSAGRREGWRDERAVGTADRGNL